MSVYKPSEDTYLLIDTLRELGGEFGRAVEVGSGSGIVSAVLTELAEEVHATDLSLEAARSTAERLKSVGAWSRCHVVCCDMLSAYRVGELFDLLASNPPYLEPERVENKTVEGGWSFLVKLVEEASKRMRRGGMFLAVVSTQTERLEMVLEKLEKLGFSASFVGSVRLFFEELRVLKAVYEM